MTKQNEPVAVHPVAAMFPMMTDEELEDLAADIAANGLRDPIMYDAKGTLIDGRNRLAACQRLGWIDFPRETLPEGEDAVAYILSKNVTRRHLSKGQAAISVARARQIQNQSEDDTQDVPKRDNIRVAAQQAGVSKTRVGLAVIVLDYAPELADAVLAGALSLDSAYETAKARKQAKEERDEAEVNAQHLQPKRYKLARRKIPRCLHRAWSIARVPMHLDGDVRGHLAHAHSLGRQAAHISLPLLSELRLFCLFVLNSK